MKNQIPPIPPAGPQSGDSWWQRFTRRVLGWVTNVCERVQTLVRRLVAGIHARLESLDAVQMQRVLVTCAIPATIALVILALANLSPIIIVLLAILALSALLQVWLRLFTLRAA